jgi:hypothetical protein
MNEENMRSLRKWLDVEPSVPLQRQGMDPAWEACVRRSTADSREMIPAPRSSPENRER